MRVKLIIEKSGKDYVGRVENPDFMPVSSASSLAELKEDIKSQIREHQQLDEPDSWANVDVDALEFEQVHDLAALFARFDYLKVSNVAEKAGMSPSLLRQYVIGIKYPSAIQARKITDAIKQIAEELSDAVAI